MVTDDDDDDYVEVNYGITIPDYNHNVSTDYDIETDDDDDDLYALIMLLSRFLTFNYVIYCLLLHFFQLSLASSILQLWWGSANLMVRLLIFMIWQYRYKYNLVQWPMTSGFGFLFDIMQLSTRSLRSPDKVIVFY